MTNGGWSLDALSMGGYARFVWPCFGFAFGVLAWNLWAARRFHAAARLRAARAVTMAASERT